jgi:hypothetical protein
VQGNTERNITSKKENQGQNDSLRNNAASTEVAAVEWRIGHEIKKRWMRYVGLEESEESKSRSCHVWGGFMMNGIQHFEEEGQEL